MDEKDRQALLHCRTKIVSDLNVKDVIDDLLSDFVLSVEDKEKIFQEKTPRDRSRSLLDLLPNKGSNAFTCFKKALETHNEWLARALEQSSNGGLWENGIERKTSIDHQRIVQDVLLKGGVPRPPAHNIKRQKVKEIELALLAMDRGQFVVLHGMSGCGKSVMAAQSISNSDLVFNNFEKGVYWLPIGDVARLGRDALLAKMKILIDKLDGYTPSPPQSVEHANQILRNAFLEEQHRNNLLVLDDVWQHEVIKAFDVGCKVLVTSRDSSIVQAVSGRSQIIQIPQGFTEEESLHYFSMCVDVDVEKLPEDALTICAECKGNPMVVSLIGAILEENRRDLINNHGRWKYYLDILKNREFSKFHMKLNNEHSVIDAIGMSIDSLPQHPVNYANYYRDFAVFVDDVNITTVVLMTLWGLSQYEVEDIMAEFVKKSLAVSKYDSKRGYVYGIHDLQLDYLKFRSKEDSSDYCKLQEIHKKMVNAYLKKCEHVYAKLPCDNYIHFYLGYHLSEAGMTELFPKIFLDLGFISAKLRITGTSDLLRDFRRYEEHIIKKDKSKIKVLEDYEEFVRMYGHFIIQNEDSDIVQLALRLSPESVVFKAAQEIVSSSPRKFYVDWKNREDLKLHRPADTVICGGHVHCVSFAGDDNLAVAAVGEAPVKVNLYNLDTGRQQHVFRGHTEKITCLTVSPDSQYLVTGSEDGTVKVWDLQLVRLRLTREAQQYNALEVTGPDGIIRTPSPCGMQESWCDMFSTTIRNEDTSIITLREGHGNINSVSCSGGNDIAVAKSDGTVQIWNILTGQRRLILGTHIGGATCGVFSDDDRLIATAGADACIMVWFADAGKLRVQFRTSLRVIGLVFVSGSCEHRILSATESTIKLWPIDTMALVGTNKVQVNGHMNVEKFERKKTALYLCIAVSHDSVFLAAGTSDHRVVLWDIPTKNCLTELPWHNGWITSLNFWSGYRFLLSGSEDETIMTWEIDMGSSKAPAMKLCHFTAAWKEEILHAAYPNDQNCIEVQIGTRTFVTEAIQSKITFLAFSTSKCLVFFGTDSGVLGAVNINTRSVDQIEQHNAAICYIDCCVDDVVVSCSADGCVKITGNVAHSEFSSCGLTVKCFVNAETQCIISCSQDGSIHLLDYVNGYHITHKVPSTDEVTVISCDYLRSKGHIGLGETKGQIHLFNLNERVFITREHSNSVVRCCRFSPSGRFFATGHDNGLVLVWNIEDFNNTGTFAELNLHKSWVRDMVFSQNSCQLLTAGDQLGWWNLDILQRQRSIPERKISSGVGRRRHRSGEKSGKSPQRLSVLLPAEEKIGRQGKRELLQNFDLGGNYVMHVFANDDFASFITVDDAGIVYQLSSLGS